MICNIPTPFLTLSISLINFWNPDNFVVVGIRTTRLNQSQCLFPRFVIALVLQPSPTTLVIYNHGQKSWNTFAESSWTFSNSHIPNPLPPPPLFTPQTTLHAYIQTFSPSFNFVEGGGRENCEKISKRKHCLMREPRNYRKIWILHYCAKDFLSMIVVFIRS